MLGSNAREAPSACLAIEMRICDIADASATGVSRSVARSAGPAAQCIEWSPAPQCIEWSPAPCGCESQRHAAVRSETYARCAESAIRRGFDASGDCLGHAGLAAGLRRVPHEVTAVHVPYVAVGPGTAEGPVMQVGQVVAIDGVLEEDLPVAAHFVGDLGPGAHPLEPVRPGDRFQIGTPLAEIGPGVRVHEHHASEFAERRGKQGVVPGVEARKTLRVEGHCPQGAVQAIGPPVIGAYDACGVQPAGAFHELRPAVPAEVVECA